MKVYAVSGLGADERVFKYLKLDHELIPVRWIAPLSYSDSIFSYTQRLSVQIDTTEPFILLGVSFGGLIVTELNKFLNPAYSILISSTDTKFGIRPLFRFFRFLSPVIPKTLFKPPKFLAVWFFGTHNKKLLQEILNDTDLTFSKWAIMQLCSWRNTEPLINVIKISGEKDKLIPAEKDQRTVVIENGEHFMIVDKAEEISKVINESLKRIL